MYEVGSTPTLSAIQQTHNIGPVALTVVLVSLSRFLPDERLETKMSGAQNQHDARLTIVASLHSGIKS